MAIVAPSDLLQLINHFKGLQTLRRRAPEPAGLTLLRDAANALALSARGYHPKLRVARTLADLDGEECVARIHIAEALSYRGETLRRAQAAA